MSVAIEGHFLNLLDIFASGIVKILRIVRVINHRRQFMISIFHLKAKEAAVLTK